MKDNRLRYHSSTALSVDMHNYLDLLADYFGVVHGKRAEYFKQRTIISLDIAQFCRMIMWNATM